MKPYKYISETKDCLTRNHVSGRKFRFTALTLPFGARKGALRGQFVIWPSVEKGPQVPEGVLGLI